MELTVLFGTFVVLLLLGVPQLPSLWALQPWPPSFIWICPP